MKITVFTPTFNRGYIIENLYHSLQRQSYQDFEWILVDDGSTDKTEELVRMFMSEDNFFPIQYIKVENGGKHRAINKGVALAKGQLFMIVDSDDYLTDNALERIVDVEEGIPSDRKNEFAGVCGNRGYSPDKEVGGSFQGDVLDITTLEQQKYGIYGDKAEVFYTDVLKRYPFPEFKGEKFLTESVVWDRIAFDGYKLRYFNEIVYICEYQPDGLSAQYRNLMDSNPRGKGLHLYQRAQFGYLKGIKKWKSFCDYYRQNRKKLGLWEIAKILHINPIELWLRTVGLVIFYRIYA